MTLTRGELSRRTLLLVLGRVPTFAVTFLLGIVLARTLDQATYGLYQGVMWLASFLPPLLVIGIAKSLDFHLPRVDRPRALLLRSYLLAGVVGAGTGLALLLGDRSPLSSITAAIVFLVFGERLLPPTLVALSEFRKLAVLQAVSAPLLLFGVLVPVLLELPLTAVLFGVLVHYGFLAGAAVIVAFRAPRSRPGEPVPGLREQAAYAIPVGLGGALAMLAGHVDKLVVWFGTPLVAFAVYKRGAMEVPILGSLSLLVLHIASPALVKAGAAGDRKGYLEILDRSARLTTVVTLPVAVFFFLVAGDFFVLLYGEAYAESATVFRLYLLLMPLRAVWTQTIFETIGRARITMILCALLLALHLPTSILLSRAGHAWGPALSMVVSHAVVWWGIGLPLAARELGVRVRNLVSWARLARVTLLSLVPALPLLVLAVIPLSHPFRLFLGGLLYFPLVFVLFVRSRVIGQSDLRRLRERR